MSTLTAVILALGALGYALLDHYLRLRRVARYATPEPAPPEPQPEPPESEERMSMSNQQLRTLGLSHVRRAIASGEYKAADVTRWKDELGEDAVQALVDEAKPTKPASRAKQSSKPDKPDTPPKE